jgi:hypothetical protein
MAKAMPVNPLVSGAGLLSGAAATCYAIILISEAYLWGRF